MKKSHANGPLPGLKILDISEGIAGPFCAKLLADLGADVVKIEPPGGGDASRQWGPFPEGQSNSELSASFFFFNTSKRSVVLDLESTEGRQWLGKLCKTFDIVIAGESIESLTKRGLSLEQFQKWNPRIILTTISGFGSFGPCSEYKSSHIIACAVGGWSQLCGTPDREPLQVGGNISDTLAGAFAAASTLLAVLGRQVHNHGEHVDVSIQEAVLAGAQMPTLLYEYRNVVPQRYSSVGSGAGAAYILPTSGGYIGLNALTAAQWQMLCDFLGCSEITDDPYYEGISWVNPDSRLEEIRGRFQSALEDRTAADLFHEAQTWRVPFGLVPDLQNLFKFPPLLEREFFVGLEHPLAGEVLVPGIAFHSTATAAKPFRPPLLGEHTDRVLAELAVDEVDPAPVSPESEIPPSPLAGLRILDLSMFFAGPVAAQIAADAGAEVIKVESVQRIDGWRGSAATWDGDVPPWESSPYFNWVNRSKRDITLNLNDKRGADILKRLVRDADVLIENYTPRVMAKFGLSWETLAAINPRLIMLSLSGFGANVSWRDYVAFGMSTEQMSGVAHLTGYANDAPIFSGMTGGDIFAGAMGAVALFSAIAYRNQTGEGQHIDLSQLEACNLYVGDRMTGYSLAGVDPGRTGNDHPVYSPHGIYRCADDRWLAIACLDAEQRLKLAAIVRPDDASQCELEELTDGIRQWCKDRNHIEAAQQLQRAGIAAGAVMDGPDLLADSHLQQRGSFLAQDRPGVGVKHYPNQPYRFRNAPTVPNLRAPMLGEHTDEVLTTLAGLSRQELDELTAADVIGKVPLAAR